MKKYIWVVGAARSGTSYLAKFIGKHTDLCYIEDQRYHPINLNNWQFPEPYQSLTFKLNNNFVRTFSLTQRFKQSYFIHIIRDPKHVLYSMVQPKEGSWPNRQEWKNNFPKAIAYWEHFITGCISIKNVPVVHVKYEKIIETLPKLSEFLGIELQTNNLNFQNRNHEMVDWDYFDYLKSLWLKPEYSEHLKLRKKIESMPDFWIGSQISMA